MADFRIDMVRNMTGVEAPEEINYFDDVLAEYRKGESAPEMVIVIHEEGYYVRVYGGLPFKDQKLVAKMVVDSLYYGREDK